LNPERRASGLEPPAGALLTYNLLLHAAAALAGPFVLPPVLARRKWRGQLGQRLGLSAVAPVPGGERPFWVHALSVGETLSALPLVAALRRRWPRRGIFFSTTTLTGQHIARQRLSHLVDRLFFFPYDLPAVVGARLRQVRPAAVILVETDLWPNFLARAAASRIPVALVNARMSRSSFHGYRRARALTRPMFERLAVVAAQTDLDARRLKALGVDANRLRVTGNLKFDQPDADDPAVLSRLYRRRLQVGPETPILVAGSTHRGVEEEALALACRGWRQRFAELRVVVAPRDPLRAAEVARLFRRQGAACGFWSRLDQAGGNEPVVVVDRMGVLRQLYAAADVAYVGGSLAGCGGHNPLEPAAMGRPVLYGPDMSDFSAVAEALEQAGGAVRIADAGALEDQGQRLLADGDQARRMGAAARNVFLSHRGAVDRTLALIAKLVEKSQQPRPPNLEP
jgi:3-deoxy-D-manno-octulosonic-acid transferase